MNLPQIFILLYFAATLFLGFLFRKKECAGLFGRPAAVLKLLIFLLMVYIGGFFAVPSEYHQMFWFLWGLEIASIIWGSIQNSTKRYSIFSAVTHVFFLGYPLKQAGFFDNLYNSIFIH